VGNAGIECLSISKKYVITHQERYLALRDRLTPSYLLERLLGGNATITREDFWALKDISFEVADGEAVGIIGRNGAGKSTLLKVLSRITHPTSGEARIKGRVASLLEVGTGFHPELTGRENIYVNGAILGMKKKDITRKFDAIVDFAGIEKFIDTPVKRYSSGMYVRLAFAVAAHLEPDILIVDEVLAVGDAEFQKRCLGKMQEVARDDGRTILFVSHNMTAIQSLCRRAIWINAGVIVEQGESPQVVASYLHRHGSDRLEQFWPDAATAPGNDRVRVRRVRIAPDASAESAEISVKSAFALEFEFWNELAGASLNVTIELVTLAGDCVFAVSGANGTYARGLFRVVCAVPGDLLNDGLYAIHMNIVQDGSKVAFMLRDALTFRILDVPRESGWMDKWPGAVRPTFFRWTATKLDQSRGSDDVIIGAPRDITIEG
jgi:lipopolysaccharide transport system ATP-binding protein